MAKITEAELKTQIKTANFSNAYLIFGQEGYLKNHYINLLRKKIVEPTFADFNYHSYNGKDTALDEILKDAELLPMMSNYNFVLVCDYPFDKSESDIKLLQEFLKDIPETTILVFWYDAIEFPFKNKDGKLSAKSTKIENAFAQAGSVIELNFKTEAELVKMLVSGFKKRGYELTPNLAKYLISISGTDIQILQNETEKICFYLKGNEVSKDIIDKLATKSLQARVNDLSKAILAGDSNKAYSVLNALFFNDKDVKPDYLLGTITKSYVDMYRVKCAKAAGMPATDIKNYFFYQYDSYINNAVRDSANLSVKQLRKSLDVLMDADNALKSTSAGSRLVFEELMVKLMLIAKEVNYD